MQEYIYRKAFRALKHAFAFSKILLRAYKHLVKICEFEVIKKNKKLSDKK